MGRNDYTNTVRDALKLMLQDDAISSGTGVMKFTRSDKRTQGKLFLRNGEVYAIHLTSYPSVIVQRIFSSGALVDDDRFQVGQKFGNDLNDPGVIDYVLTHQMMPQKVVTDIVKDYFLGAFDELYSWGDTKAEWRKWEETSDLTIPSASPSTLLSVVENREKFIQNTANAFGISVENLQSVTYKNKKSATPENQILANILSLATGSHNVAEVHSRFGISFFVIIQKLYTLWVEETIEVLYEGHALSIPAELISSKAKLAEVKTASVPVITPIKHAREAMNQKFSTEPAHEPAPDMAVLTDDIPTKEVLFTSNATDEVTQSVVSEEPKPEFKPEVNQIFTSPSIQLPTFVPPSPPTVEVSGYDDSVTAEDSAPAVIEMVEDVLEAGEEKEFEEEKLTTSETIEALQTLDALNSTEVLVDIEAELHEFNIDASEETIDVIETNDSTDSDVPDTVQNVSHIEIEPVSSGEKEVPTFDEQKAAMSSNAPKSRLAQQIADGLNELASQKKELTARNTQADNEIADIEARLELKRREREQLQADLDDINSQYDEALNLIQGFSR